jgi:cation-transporting ATPase 13A2
MRDMSRFSCPVTVLVDGACMHTSAPESYPQTDVHAGVERDSPSLVPGDVVNLTASALAVVPADMFLLGGDAIVNESMLTGESVPVSKAPVPDGVLAGWRTAPDVSADASKAFLFSGTRVVRVRGALAADGSTGAPATALVARTGFATTKGALVRSMLFPKPMGFKFYRDSIRFILVLTGIAGLGFCASAVQFVRLGIPATVILLRALDLITVVVPPALPATLSIGTSFALGRLREKGVFCISPSRVNVAGKVNVCCFDKTGTLTEDGLDVLGVRAPAPRAGISPDGTAPASRFGELVEDVHDLPTGDARERARFLHALATCHSLKNVDGAPIGDPLDVKMFEFTRWALEEGAVAGTGMIRDRAGGDRPAALVQTVVRPPGGGGFRVEDALRGDARVRSTCVCSRAALTTCSARTSSNSA